MHHPQLIKNIKFSHHYARPFRYFKTSNAFNEYSKKISHPLNSATSKIFRPLKFSVLFFRPLKFFVDNFAPLKKCSRWVPGRINVPPLIECSQIQKMKWHSNLPIRKASQITLTTKACNKYVRTTRTK